MRVIEIIPNLPVPDIAAAHDFYGGFLGLQHVPMGNDWVTRYVGEDPAASLQLVTRDATAPVDSVASVRVTDVDEAYELAKERGYEIVHPLTNEPWGVRRFFVRTLDGNVLNIVGVHV